MFRLAVVASLVATASAFLGNVQPDSKQLRNLLKDATLIEGRGLNNNNNYQYQLNDAMAMLYVKYTGCANTLYLSNNGNGGNNNNKNGGNGLITSSVVSFEIRESCNGDLIGKYATPMVQFADAYAENMMTEQQWRCEQYIELYCDDCKDDYDAGDGGACYVNCTSGKTDYSGYDVSVCGTYIQQQGENKEEFNIQRYLECGKMQGNNNNNNNGNNYDYTQAYEDYPEFDGKYRVGPYCADDGYSILLGLWYDQYCSVHAPEDTYEMLYGDELPYSKTSIVPHGACVACADPQAENQNNNNNNNGQAYAREVCSESYYYALKCEDTGSAYLATYGATTSGCEFVEEFIPAVQYASSTTNATEAEKKAGIALSWVFAFTTVLFAGYAYFLYSKLRRGSNLASRDGALA